MRDAISPQPRGLVSLSRPFAAAVVLLPLLLVAFGITTTASASEIAYECGPNLCAINPDGTGQKQLTTDGTGLGHRYIYPSISRDGSKLAFTFEEHWFLGSASAPSSASGAMGSFISDIEIRPDGVQVLYEGGFPTEYVCVSNADGSGTSCPYAAPEAPAAWSADDAHILISVKASVAPFQYQILYLPLSGATQGPVKASDPAHDLIQPAVSPDGSTLAVTVAAGAPGSLTGKGNIALYNYNTGAFVRELTPPTDTEDAAPVWSPDGTQLAFERGGVGGSIYVISASGSPGSERLLTSGSVPTWGGGSCDTLPGGPACGGLGGNGGSGGNSGSGGGSKTGGGSTVTSAQIAAQLAGEITPSGKGARIAKLLKGAYSLTFRAPEAGTAVVDWYYLPPGAKLAKKTKAKPVLVAAGKHTFSAAGTATLKIGLTGAGKQLLKHSKRVKLTAKGVFTSATGEAVTATKSFVLR
jgi:hypothetical protein